MPKADVADELAAEVEAAFEEPVVEAPDELAADDADPLADDVAADWLLATWDPLVAVLVSVLLTVAAWLEPEELPDEEEEAAEDAVEVPLELLAPLALVPDADWPEAEAELDDEVLVSVAAEVAPSALVDDFDECFVFFTTVIVWSAKFETGAKPDWVVTTVEADLAAPVPDELADVAAEAAAD